MNYKIMASHQPHFFPWMGYLDKMAKADIFAINDIVQPEDKSALVRNKILSPSGQIQYVNVAISSKNRLNMRIMDVQLSDYEGTKGRVLGRLKNCYGKAPCFKEIYPWVQTLFDKEYKRLLDLDLETIDMYRHMLGITTPVILHSQLELPALSDNKSDNIITKCKACGANIYLSGTGGSKVYLESDKFRSDGIQVVFQNFTHPLYKQAGSGSNLLNLSFLDMLFNCGINETKKIFWNNVNNSHELDVFQ